MNPAFLAAVEQGAIVIRVKAVPGASRDEIAGPLGDRLKVRVAAPPEGGRANASIERVIAAALGISARAVRVTAGNSGPEKLVRIEGAGAEILARLAGTLPHPTGGQASVGRGQERPQR